MEQMEFQLVETMQTELWVWPVHMLGWSGRGVLKIGRHLNVALASLTPR